MILSPIFTSFGSGTPRSQSRSLLRAEPDPCTVRKLSQLSIRACGVRRTDPLEMFVRFMCVIVQSWEIATQGTKQTTKIPPTKNTKLTSYTQTSSTFAKHLETNTAHALRRPRCWVCLRAPRTKMPCEAPSGAWPRHRFLCRRFGGWVGLVGCFFSPVVFFWILFLFQKWGGVVCCL